jgi:hypothetical protein
MKKGLMALAASAVVCSMAFASPKITSVEQMATPLSEIQMMSESLNQNESIALFGTDKVETVALLSQSEMLQTQGAGGWTRFRNKITQPKNLVRIVQVLSAAAWIAGFPISPTFTGAVLKIPLP